MKQTPWRETHRMLSEEVICKKKKNGFGRFLAWFHILGNFYWYHIRHSNHDSYKILTSWDWIVPPVCIVVGFFLRVHSSNIPHLINDPRNLADNFKTIMLTCMMFGMLLFWMLWSSEHCIAFLQRWPLIQNMNGLYWVRGMVKNMPLLWRAGNNGCPGSMLICVTTHTATCVW